MKKTAHIIIACLFVVCGQTMANFSGGDNFNDNSMDTNKWEHDEQQVDAFLKEANGRLELTSTANILEFRPLGRNWIANSGSYTQNWTMTYETVNSLDETAIVNNECSIGFWLSGGVSNDYFGLSHDKANYGIPEHWFSVGGSSAGVDVMELPQDLTNDYLAIRLVFEALTKTLHFSYDDGGGFIPFVDFNVSGWGMTGGDEFIVHLGGGDRGMAIPSGQVYGDNFTLTASADFPTEADLKTYCPPSLIGSWVFGDTAQPNDSAVLTFMTNGVYYFGQDGDGSEPDGMEYGTYTWNAGSGLFNSTTLRNSCGDYGLSGWPGNETLVVTGNVLTVYANEGTFIATRAQNIPDSIYGSWLHSDGTVHLSFFINGIYYLEHDWTPDPTGQPGIERGTYTWNSFSGDFSRTVLLDTNGEWGLSHATILGVTADGNTLYLDADDEGIVVFTRVIEPLCSDLDGDGLPDVWEQQYFSNPTNATSGGNGDGDTLDNRAEYIAGTIPTSGSSAFEVSDAGSSLSGFVLNWTAVEGRAYGVKWADSLTNGFQSLATDIAYPQNSYTDTVHTAEGEGFYSIDVKLEN